MVQADRRLTFFVSLLMLGFPSSSRAQKQPVATALLETSTAREAFLSTARIVDDAGPPSPARTSWRVQLDDGTRTRDAGVEAADGSDPTGRNHKFNVAAYELSKALGLNLVPPSVERVVGGRPASLTWWLDDFAMNEVDRRRQGIAPPDLERWNRQVQAVRVFDELISNTYRDVAPPLYLNTVWDSLLITKDWTVWITDHTGAFRNLRQLDYPESLARCDRALLDGLRKLNRPLMQRMLGKYLSSQQLDALEARRELLVQHFDRAIASKGQAAVLYDLPPRQ